MSQARGKDSLRELILHPVSQHPDCSRKGRLWTSSVGIAWELIGSEGLTPDLLNKNLHFTIIPSWNFIKILGDFCAY